MKKTKKIIIICIFSALILLTAVLFIAAAIESYNYDMNPDNGVDIMEGIGAAILIVVGGFIVFYEIDLFCTTYYFLVKPKTTTKTILNLLSNLSLLLVFFSDDLANILYTHLNIFEEDWLLPLFLVFIYIILRLVYCAVSVDALHSKN